MEPLEEWEYNGHPNEKSVELACLQIVTLASGAADILRQICNDTRPFHGEVFCGVVPPGKEYLAGNYRGANFPQLLRRPVMLIYPHKIYHGAAAEKVESEMREFHLQLLENFSRFKVVAKEKGWDAFQKLAAFSALVGMFFARFLAIHPYANGNGHMSRLLLWSIFTMHSVNAAFWQVPSRNLQPPDHYIAEYREGNSTPLIRAFMQLIAAENNDLAI